MKAIRIAAIGIALLAGTRSAYAVCPGDCDDSNTVAVNELVVGVNIALDRAELSQCPSFDINTSGGVEVNELVTAVNNLLRDSCPPVEATATPTETTSVVVNTPTPTLPPPTITFKTCSFNGTGDSLALYLTDTTLFSTLQPDGELGVGCTEGTTGTRQCACQFRSFDPLELTGIGFVCITEGQDAQGNPAQCPIGRQLCEAGGTVNTNVLADAQIGSCTSNADCAAKCDTYCAGLNPPHQRFIGACESHCQGGDRADEMCECDTVGAQTCNPGSTLGCPLGSCEGKDNEADVDCHCQCVNESAAGESDAGAFQCRLAVSIRVEANSPCDNTDVLVRLPPQCAPLTSDQHVGTVINVNEDSQAEIAPDPLQGVSRTCTDFDTALSGMKLVTNLAFFDSTVGDLMSQLSLTCE